MCTPAPDFVIVGAPKCGTTSLFQTLRTHPALALSSSKEPSYFATDFPRRREVETPESYDALFAHAIPGQLRGEASVIYLYSETAIPAILRQRPDAKFIAVVRDPVEVFISWHNECVNSLDEDEKDPEMAWRLQSQRAAGCLPRYTKEPGFLQYRNICSLGSQIERLFRLVPQDQRLVVVFDDLVRDPQGAYRRIGAFLGIPTAPLKLLVHEGAFSTHTSPLVALVARSVYASDLIKRLRLQLKPLLNKLGIRPLAWAVCLSLKRVPKPRLSPQFRAELQWEFSAEVRLLEKLLQRDLAERSPERPIVHSVAS